MKNSSIIIKTGTLRTSDSEFLIQEIDASFIDQILQLQQDIYDSLPEENKSFILVKPKSFFENHFKSDQNKMIGIFVDNKLIAQSIILQPTIDNPSTGMVDMENIDDVESLSIIEGVLVNPEFRGNSLMEEMVTIWLDIAEKMGRKHAIAEVVTDNPFSWNVFLKKNLNIHSIGIDPDDQTKLYNMHETIDNIREKELKGPFNYHGAKPKKSCHVEDFKQQSQLMTQGYKGISYSKPDSQMLMARFKY